MMRPTALFVFALALSWCSAALAGLLPCPDCGKPVSDRAMMCPNCGCPGAVILATAHSNQTATAELPTYCHSLVRITTDRNEGVGVCTRSAGQLYVLTAQSLLAGAQTLTVTKLIDGQSIPYTGIELANDRNLARLAVMATNLSPLAIFNETSADLALVHIATNNAVALILTGSASAPIPIGTPLLNTATNIVLIVDSSDARHAENVASVPEWIPVQPLAYRTQSALLLRRGKLSTDKGATLKQLQETKWLTPWLAKQAQIMIDQQHEQERVP